MIDVAASRRHDLHDKTDSHQRLTTLFLVLVLVLVLGGLTPTRSFCLGEFFIGKRIPQQAAPAPTAQEPSKKSTPRHVILAEDPIPSHTFQSTLPC